MWATVVQHLYCNMFINLSARWKNRDVIIHSAGLLSRRMQLLIKEEVRRPAGIKWAFHLTEGSAAVGLTSALSVHLLNLMTGNGGMITTFFPAVESFLKISFWITQVIIWHCGIIVFYRIRTMMPTEDYRRL